MTTFSTYTPVSQLSLDEILHRLTQFSSVDGSNHQPWTYGLAKSGSIDWPKGLYWSGGSLLTCMDRGRNIDSDCSDTEDIDLWVIKPYWSNLGNILTWLCQGRSDAVLTLTGDIVTINSGSSSTGKARSIQLIISSEETMDDVVSNFDMMHCSGYFDGTSITMTAEMTEALANRKVNLDIGLYRPWRWLKLARYSIVPSNLTEIRSVFKSARYSKNDSTTLEDFIPDTVWWTAAQEFFNTDPISRARSTPKDPTSTTTNPMTIEEIVSALAARPAERNSSCYMNAKYTLNLTESIPTNRVILKYWASIVEAVEDKTINGKKIYSHPLKLFLPPVLASQTYYRTDLAFLVGTNPSVGFNITPHADAIEFLSEVEDVLTTVNNANNKKNYKPRARLFYRRKTAAGVEYGDYWVYGHYGDVNTTTHSELFATPVWTKITQFKEQDSIASLIRGVIDVYGDYRGGIIKRLTNVSVSSSSSS